MAQRDATPSEQRLRRLDDALLVLDLALVLISSAASDKAQWRPAGPAGMICASRARRQNSGSARLQLFERRLVRQIHDAEDARDLAAAPAVAPGGQHRAAVVLVGERPQMLVHGAGEIA